MLTGQFKWVDSPSQTALAMAPEWLESLSDEELLDRFLSRDDATAEPAFRAIVVRHGPMVLGVCRHVLNQLQDAEDAFQATFLVLARKGGSIRDRRVLARWLYEVAYRIAMRARSNRVRRREYERQGGEMATTVSFDNPGRSELKPIIHEEVNRLPEKYRLPVILSYLEGKTNEEVARLLDWPVGTVKGRLSRARDLLRSRLSRRGLALSAAFLVTSLANGTVFADVVPPRLIDETVANALVIAALKEAEEGATPPTETGGVIPPEVSRLMNLAAGDLWVYKRSIVAALLLLVIAGALASLGLSSGLPFDPRPVGNLFLHPFGRMAIGPPQSPVLIQTPDLPPTTTSTGSCHSTEPALPSTP